MHSANSHTNIITQVGDLGDFGEALYMPGGLGNFISEPSLRNEGWFVTKPHDRFIVTKNNKVIYFDLDKDLVYYIC